MSKRLIPAITTPSLTISASESAQQGLLGSSTGPLEKGKRKSVNLDAAPSLSSISPSPAKKSRHSDQAGVLVRAQADLDLSSEDAEPVEALVVHEMQSMRSKLQRYSAMLDRASDENKALQSQVVELQEKWFEEKSSHEQDIQTQRQKLRSLSTSVDKAVLNMEDIGRQCFNFQNDMSSYRAELTSIGEALSALQFEQGEKYKTLDEAKTMSVDFMNGLRQLHFTSTDQMLLIAHLRQICNRNAGTMAEDRDQILELTSQVSILANAQGATRDRHQQDLDERDHRIEDLTSKLRSMELQIAAKDGGALQEIVEGVAGVRNSLVHSQQQFNKNNQDLNLVVQDLKSELSQVKSSLADMAQSRQQQQDDAQIAERRLRSECDTLRESVRQNQERADRYAQEVTDVKQRSEEQMASLRQNLTAEHELEVAACADRLQKTQEIEQMELENQIKAQSSKILRLENEVSEAKLSLKSFQEMTNAKSQAAQPTTSPPGDSPPQHVETKMVPQTSSLTDDRTRQEVIRSPSAIATIRVAASQPTVEQPQSTGAGERIYFSHINRSSESMEVDNPADLDFINDTPPRVSSTLGPVRQEDQGRSRRALELEDVCQSPDENVVGPARKEGKASRRRSSAKKSRNP